MVEKEQLPAVMTAADIAGYLKISRRRVYEFLLRDPEQGGIRHAKFGASKRIERSDFMEWVEKQKTGGRSK